VDDPAAGDQGERTIARPRRNVDRPQALVPGREVQAARLISLVQRSARGHEDAFSDLYDETCARLYGVILRVIRSPDLAQEVTQEVYIEIWRQAGRYPKERCSVLAWMTTVAHRRAVDRVRAETSDLTREHKYLQSNTEREVDQVWDVVEQRFDVQRVRKAMASLTEIQREALTLAYFGGYTHAQVAELLDLPLGTAKTRIRDGLIGLRDAFAQQT
jgi:RNA polymerase sigma-70 factor, ECF subfamily